MFEAQKSAPRCAKPINLFPEGDWCLWLVQRISDLSRLGASLWSDFSTSEKYLLRCKTWIFGKVKQFLEKSNGGYNFFANRIRATQVVNWSANPRARFLEIWTREIYKRKYTVHIYDIFNEITYIQIRNNFLIKLYNDIN